MTIWASIIVTLLVLGLLLWAIEALPFLDATIKQILKVVIVVIAALRVLQAFGLIGQVT